MKKFAVVLSGSGVYDGSEIHEAALTMLAIKQAGAGYELFAPNIDQHHVINHITGEEMPEKRNVLVESARIARGEIKDLKDYHPGSFDALIFPGGFGAAKNLCDFAFKGADCNVNEDVARAVRETAETGKPIGALCISPVIMAKLFGEGDMTIGQDPGTAEAMGKMGVNHKQTDHGEVVLDQKNKVFTTPCYMLDATILDIHNGATNIVNAMLESM